MGNYSLVQTREHFTGAASEYIAAAWYLGKGCQVYWPSCQQGAVDFVVDLAGKLQRVQVKTVTEIIDQCGRPYWRVRTRLTNKYQHHHPQELYDMLFLVAPDGRMWEIPSDVINSSNLSVGKHSGRPTRWDTYRVTG